MILQDIGLKYETDKATFHKYMDFYQKNLPKRNFKGRLLEIGVMDGYSLKTWREYYPHAEIVGIDIEDKSHLDIEGVTILEMDATKLKDLEKLGYFDIIIDDGSHLTGDQQKSFKYLYTNSLNPKGYYIIEDLHTSYMPSYITTKFNTIEFLDNEFLEYKFFQRDPNVKDSMSCIIKAGQL